MKFRPRASKPGIPKSPGHAQAHMGPRTAGMGFRKHQNPQAGVTAPPPGMAGAQTPQIASQTGQENAVQNMLGNQASMQRIRALQTQMGVPATPQGQI